MMDEMGRMMSGSGMAAVWILWVLGIALLAHLASMLTGMSRRAEQPVLARVSTVEDVLRGQLERGEISVREFECMMRQLRDS